MVENKTVADAPARKTVRWIFGLTLVAVIHFAGSFWIREPSELFWMLLPIHTLILAFWLKLIPVPKLAKQSKWNRVATLTVLICGPVIFYVGLVTICQSPFSLKECLLAEYFFVFCIEVPLLYFFNLLEWIDKSLSQKLTSVPNWCVTGCTRVLGYLILIPMLLSVFAIHRPKLMPPPYSFLQQELSEKISFTSREDDPVTLRGEFLTHPDANGTVIVCHGVGANRGDIELIVKEVYNSCFNVLAFDFRGHGESDGHTVTYGVRERFDVLGAYDYCLGRDDVDPDKLYAIGISMGGSSLMLALPEMDQVQAAIIDSSYADLTGMAHHQLRFFPPWIRNTLVEIANVTAQLEIGVNIHDVRPVDAIAQANCPITLIHGQADNVVPHQHGQILSQQIPTLVEFYAPADIGHVGTAILDAYQYRQLIKRTFGHDSSHSVKSHGQRTLSC